MYCHLDLPDHLTLVSLEIDLGCCLDTNLVILNVTLTSWV